MRMRTSGGRGGSTRAKRENVAPATARRASHEVASNPLSPTKFEKPAQRAGFFASAAHEDENLRGQGGSTRAKRENVAPATARRASHEVASNPLSPTKFEKPAQRAGFFASAAHEDENLRGQGGSTRAKRENVAPATARRASHEVASNPLAPTKFGTALIVGYSVSVLSDLNGNTPHISLPNLRPISHYPLMDL